MGGELGEEAKENGEEGGTAGGVQSVEPGRERTWQSRAVTFGDPGHFFLPPEKYRSRILWRPW